MVIHSMFPGGLNSEFKAALVLLSCNITGGSCTSVVSAENQNKAPRCVHMCSVWDRNTPAEHARGLNDQKCHWLSLE